MSVDLRFTVYGTPVPQGSTRAFIPKGWNRPIITAANSKTKPWRQEIAGAAIKAMEWNSPINGPVYLRADFYFDKPKSTKKSVTHKTTKPDIDKLVRSVSDALTGVVFGDDSQIVQMDITKRFGSPARVEIRVGSNAFGAE